MKRAEVVDAVHTQEFMLLFEMISSNLDQCSHILYISKHISMNDAVPLAGQNNIKLFPPAVCHGCFQTR